MTLTKVLITPEGIKGENPSYPFPDKDRCRNWKSVKNGKTQCEMLAKNTEIGCLCHILDGQYDSFYKQATEKALEFEEQETVKAKILGYHFDHDSGYWFNWNHTDMKSQLPTLKPGLYAVELTADVVWQIKRWHQDIWETVSEQVFKKYDNRVGFDYRTIFRIVDRTKTESVKG